MASVGTALPEETRWAIFRATVFISNIITMEQPTRTVYINR